MASRRLLTDTNIANSSRFMKDEEVKLAFEKGVYPVPFAIAYDCIVPVVHPDNPLTDISMAQLKSIYMARSKLEGSGRP